MPAYRNGGPLRRAISLDEDRYYLAENFNMEPASTSVAVSSFSTRSIHTPGSRIQDSPLSGSPVSRRLRLILHGPRDDGNSDTRKPITSPLAMPTPHHASPSSNLPNNPKRRRISPSPHTSNPPPADPSEAIGSCDISEGRTIPFKPRRPRKQDKDYIPRPKNAFILFRSEFYQKFTQATNEERLRTLDQANISQQAALRWNSLSEEERVPYKTWAAAEKKAHETMYPNYSFTPDKRKPKSPRKTSRAFKARAPSGGLPPSQLSLEPRLRPLFPSPATGFSLHPASWGSENAGEPGSRTNPISESSPYMNQSDEEVSEDFGSTRMTGAGVINEQPTHRPQATNNVPMHLAHDRGSAAPSTDIVQAPFSSVPSNVTSVTTNVARVIRPLPSLNAELSRIAGVKPGNFSRGEGGHSELPSDRTNRRVAYHPNTTASTSTFGGLGGAQTLQARVSESLAPVEAESVHVTNFQLNMQAVIRGPSTITFSPPMEEVAGQGSDNASYLDNKRRLAMPRFGISLEELPIAPPTTSHDELRRRFATSRFRVTSEEPPIVLLHANKRSFVVEEPSTVPPAMLLLERKRRFATSRFRVMSEEPPSEPSIATKRKRSPVAEETPVVPPTMSPLERERRFATSRFRITEEPPMIVPPMSSLERKRRFSTSRFCVMSEEPPPAVLPSGKNRDYRGSFATSRLRAMPEEPPLSLLQRTSRFINSLFTSTDRSI